MNTTRRTSLSLAAFLLTACGVASPYPVYSIENDTEMASTVVAGDPSLAARVRAGRARLDRVADNRLKVSVPIRNISDEVIQVLVQIAWRDRQQMSLGDESNLQVMTIRGGGTVEFVSVSRSDAAENYVVRLDWNK